MNEWDKYIQPVLFAYRTKILRNTGKSPFVLTYGVEPTLFADQPKEEIDLIDRMMDLIDDVPHLRHTAKDRIIRTQAKLAQSYQVR